MKSTDLDLLASQFNPFNGTQLCLEYDPDTFFPEYNDDRRVEYLKEVSKAKKICGDCWIKEDCLKYALQQPDLEGVWGGTTRHERKKIKKLKISAI